MNTYSPFFNTFAARKFLKNIIVNELPIKFYTHMKTCYFTVGINDDIRMDVYYHSGVVLRWLQFIIIIMLSVLWKKRIAL